VSAGTPEWALPPVANRAWRVWVSRPDDGALAPRGVGDSWCAGARRLRLWVMEDARRRACHTLPRARRRKIVPRKPAENNSDGQVTTATPPPSEAIWKEIRGQSAELH